MAKQRVSEKDAKIIYDKLVKNFKGQSTESVYDHAGGSESFINEQIVLLLIKRLTR